MKNSNYFAGYVYRMKNSEIDSILSADNGQTAGGIVPAAITSHLCCDKGGWDERRPTIDDVELPAADFCIIGVWVSQTLRTGRPSAVASRYRRRLSFRVLDLSEPGVLVTSP